MQKKENNVDELIDLVRNIDSSEIPDKYKQRMDDSVATALLQHIILNTTDQIPESKQESFVSLLESDVTPTDIDTFLRTVITDYEQVMGKIVRDFFVRLAQKSDEASDSNDRENE